MVGLTCRRFVAALIGLAIQGIQVGGILHRFGGIALIVHEFAVDNDLVAYLDVGLVGGVGLVAEVRHPVAIELGILEALVADVEAGIAVSAALGIGQVLTGLAVLRYLGYLALDIERTDLFVAGGGCPGEVFDSLDGGSDVEWIVLRSGALGIRGLYRSLLVSLAVERVQVCGTLDGLGSISTVIHELAVEDHLVAYLDVWLAGHKGLVTDISHPVGIELSVLEALVADVERGIAVSAALSKCEIRTVFLGNPGNLALDIVRTGLLVVVVGSPGEVLDGLDGGRDVERILLRAITLRIGCLWARAAGHSVQRVQVGIALAGLIDGVTAAV